MGDWLESVHLRDNPFRYYSARREEVDAYFVRPGALFLPDLITDPQVWVIFGERGQGKTSLRMMVAARCRPFNLAADALALEFGRQELANMVRKAASLKELILNHWVETILEQAIPLLPEEQRPRWMSVALSTRQGVVFIAYSHEDRPHVDELAETLEKAGIAVWYDRKLHGARRWHKELEERIKSARALVAVLSRQSRDSEWMEREALYALKHSVPVIPFFLEKVDLPLWAINLQPAFNKQELIRTLRVTGRLQCVQGYERLGDLASSAGVHRVVCLVDEVDEIPEIREQSDVLRLLSCLMAPELRGIDGIAFRYFLPASMEEPLSRNLNFRLDRCRVEYLRWNPADLKRLIGRRMTAFSSDQKAPYQSLGQICDPAGGFASRIDDELADLAEGNPRAAICLADTLIRLHCREENPPRFIQPQTWEEVKNEWWQRGRARIIGASGAEQPFQVHRDQIFFQGREITLSRRYHALLYCLVQAGGRCCSIEDLARAGWPNEDPAGVTSAAVNEAIRRLRQKLQEQGIQPEWIETVRGRGYRIRFSLNNPDDE